MKAELDKDGVLWIRGETIVESLYIIEVLSKSEKHKADHIGWSLNVYEGNEIVQ